MSTTETVTADQLKAQDVVRLPGGNAEVVFVKVSAKTTMVTFKREAAAGSFGGRQKNAATFERFIR